MSAIIRFAVRSADFELGRILQLRDGMTLDLETYIPSGEQSELVFSLSTSSADETTAFIGRTAPHRSVTTIEVIDTFEKRTLLALDWDTGDDILFRSVRRVHGRILRVIGTTDEWEFVVRFRSHTDIRAFRGLCEDGGVEFTPRRIYHEDESATASDRLPFGVTDRQREALVLAIHEGYFDLPRRCSTTDLADELGISEQAVSERLRRGIANVLRHTLAEPTEQEESAID